MTRSFVDSLGRELRLTGTPHRIVSLVPSITETLFSLGLGPSIAGVTDYCVHPAEGVREKPRLGGTKNPRLDELLELAPDLVIANREENRRRDVERLAAAGVPVFVTDARDVEAAIRELEVFGELTTRAREARSIAEGLREALRVARESRPDPAPRVVSLVWRRPYMAVGGDTFDTMLGLLNLGGRVVVCGTAATDAWVPPPSGLRPERNILVSRLRIQG